MGRVGPLATRFVASPVRERATRRLSSSARGGVATERAMAFLELVRQGCLRHAVCDRSRSGGDRPQQRLRRAARRGGGESPPCRDRPRAGRLLRRRPGKPQRHVSQRRTGRESRAAAGRRPTADLRPDVSLPRRSPRGGDDRRRHRPAGPDGGRHDRGRPGQRDGHVRRRRRRLGQLAALGEARSEARGPARDHQQPRQGAVASRRFCRSCSTACSRSSCRPTAALS